MESLFNTFTQYILGIFFILLPLLYLLIARYIALHAPHSTPRTLCLSGLLISFFSSISTHIPLVLSHLFSSENLALVILVNNVLFSIGKLLFMLGILLLFQALYKKNKKQKTAPQS